MTPQLRILGLIGAVVIVVITGLWLTRSGRPYSSALLNIHKLVALAAVIAIGVLAYRANAASALQVLELAVLGLAALLVIASFASGGVVSTMKAPPAWVSWVHRIAPYLTVVAAAAAMYIVARRW